MVQASQPSFLQRATNRIHTDADTLWRTLTARQRALPDFIIIGVQKAGTSSLFSLLSQHPDIIPPSRKEVHYFDGGLITEIDTFQKGPLWYRSHFPREASLKQAGQLTFEASPMYLFSPVVPSRIAELLPKIKLIVLLRDPVERAISHYFHEVRMARETRDIQDCLHPDKTTLRDFEYKDFASVNSAYLERGFYAEQLSRYFALFPREHILVLESGAFFSNLTPALSDVQQFLGLNDTFKLKNARPQNVNSEKRPVSQDLKDALIGFYRPYNVALFELLGVTYNWATE